MELETKTVLLTVDGTYEAELQRLQSEGWTIRRDIPQVFHIVREKPEPVGMAQGKMRFDESKVFVMGPDGVIRKQ
jgi:hypothetical protein